MNRSMLIVICDFLVLSLLSLATFDRPSTNAPPAVASQPAETARPDGDVVDALSMALQQERQSREQLISELSRSQQQIRTQEQLLALRSQRIDEFQRNLQKKESEAQQLANARQNLEQEIASAQTSLESLKQQLTSSSSEVRISQEKLQSLQAELRRRQEESAQMQQRLAQLENTHRATETEKQQLATQLQVAETEKRLARAQIDMMKTEVQAVREEKAKLHEQTSKLTEGVTALAEKSTELAQKSDELREEIRENRPLAANSIFSDFVANRVQADFQAIRRGLFGREVSRDREAKTILIQDGAKMYALLHVNDTPLQFADPGTDWDWLTGNLRRKSSVVPIDHLWFLHTDPRVAVVPITTNQATSLAAKVYRITQEPYKFQDAVVVGASEGYYGECKFQLDPALPNYVKMEHSTIKGLFGKFNPSQGDLVFTKTGELLGLMVNNQYCAVINNFTRSRGIKFGIDVTEQKTGLLLSELRGRVERLPFPLQ